MALVNLGNTTNGSDGFTFSVNIKTASLFTATSTGRLTTGKARIWQEASGTTDVRMFVYTTTGGSPSATRLLAVTDSITVGTTSESEVSFSFTGSNKAFITAGVTYLIGVHQAGSTANYLNVSRSSTADQSYWSSDTFSDGTSSTFGTPNLQVGPIDAYVVYDDAIKPSNFMPFF